MGNTKLFFQLEIQITQNTYYIILSEMRNGYFKIRDKNDIFKTGRDTGTLDSNREEPFKKRNVRNPYLNQLKSIIVQISRGGGHIICICENYT